MSGRGRVIKASEMGSGRLQPFNPDDALKRVESKVDEANARLSEDRQKAEAMVQAIYDKAYKEGRQAGYDEGKAKAEAEVEAAHEDRIAKELADRSEPLMQTLKSVSEQLAETREEWIREWEPTAMELVTSIASRLVRRLVRVDNEVAQRTLREILGLVARSPKITVYVSPSDLEGLQKNTENWRDAISKLTEVELSSDPKLSPGGCRVETDFSTIDASVETQIERLLNEIVSDTLGVQPSPPPKAAEAEPVPENPQDDSP